MRITAEIYLKLLFITIFFLLEVSSISCSAQQQKYGNVSNTEDNIGKKQNKNSTSASQGNPESLPSNVKANFANFTYPWVSGMGNPKESFTLVKGMYKLQGRESINLEYIGKGDVTGDRVDEYFVVLGWVTGGSAIPHAVYVYTYKSGKPILLWSLATGDRSDNGLRRIYAENGHLVLETYYEPNSSGSCCASHYNLIKYTWSDGRFNEVERKIIDIAEGYENASPKMEPFSPLEN
jgi:hypothetical protein